ncbi:MAG: hypothetical protein V2J24_20155 [Pseudomonadales bacterium]|jgi:hypothetical protein|nr:hypothetical protein [Pseudomonadales bacterium]
MNAATSRLRVLILATLFMLVSGCAQIDRLAADGIDTSVPSRAVVTSYVAMDSLAELAVALHDAGLISDADRAEARRILDQAYDVTVAAERSLLAGDEEEGARGLDQINALLHEVRGVLARE